ncbi:MAG: glycine--tRNA ligase [Verrucomicrobiota bacterium]
MADNSLMDKIVALCKRRGFIFQSSEIYGGLNGAWDYGPLGSQLKKNIKDHWWRAVTQLRDDIVGMDGAILMNRAVWKASGHEDTFSDPMVDCLLTNQRFRADQIEPQSGTVYSYTGAKSDELDFEKNTPYSVLAKKGEDANKARKTAKQFYARGLKDPSKFKSLELLGETTEEVKDSTQFNPENGSLLTEPREFNLMFKTYVGPLQDDANATYLRPETAQAMFVQFKNVLDTSRMKLPFGIAQIGKAFRNEINPRNFTFRSREFEQMEIEFFVKPDSGFEWCEHWLEERLKWYESIGVPRKKIHILDVPEEDRAFYSKKTYDLEYEFPFGIQELEGIAYRTNYDLTKHQEASGKPLEYFDEETKKKYIPHVVEPSAGVDRTTLAVICEAFDEEEVKNDKGKIEVRTVLRFSPGIAPIKVGIFPLLKNKPELVEKAREVEAMLRPHLTTFYDEAGAIGRRYRRQDEVGTPFGVTIDFETLEGVEDGEDKGKKDTVTLRYRDSMKQERISIEELKVKLLSEMTA